MSEAFVLDRDSILARLGGDTGIYAVMVDMFLQDLDSNCNDLAAALNSGQATEVRRAAHTVKGLLATFSDEIGAAAALAVERQAKEGQLDGMEWEIPALQARLREVGAVLAAARSGG